MPAPLIRPTARLFCAVLALTLLLPDLGMRLGAPAGLAFAQDDGGDDDDDDDGGGDDDGGAGGDDDDGGTGGSARGDDDDDDDAPQPRRTAPREPAPPATRQPATPRAVAPAPPPPAFAPEIVVTNLSDADLATLLTEGFSVIERIALTEVAIVLHRLQAPDDLTLDQARDRVRAQPTGTTGDFNHFYRSDQDSGSAGPLPAEQAAPAPSEVDCSHLNCDTLDLIGWPDQRSSASTCRVTTPIGVIDTGVNAAHESLAGARIEVLRLVAEEVDPSQAVHGTAVAALLVGRSDQRAPGLVPEASVVAVDVFGREGADERASAASLVQALDLLANRGIRVINLSLSGPANTTLEAVLRRLTSGPGGAIVLAAAGNGGPEAEIAYPAGYDTVVSVTAVDKRGQIYRRAQRGAHIDLAAPGVEVWTATSIRGVKPKTGTSLAVPFVTAVAAILASRGADAPAAAVTEQLRGLVRDLGAPGTDEIYGAGLLTLASLCDDGNLQSVAE